MNEAVTVTRDSVVSLREVTAETVHQICKLSVAESQKEFVAPNAVSIAEAYFSKEAWFRAIYAGETPVGFVMLYDNPAEPVYFLWRYMIDERYQGHGFGRQAIELLVEHVKGRPEAKELLLSCVPGEAGPEKFYRKLGFEATGKWHDEEMEMRIGL
jgi:diamine N-acetyltransferase